MTASVSRATTRAENEDEGTAPVVAVLESPDRTSSSLAHLQKAKLQMISAFTDCKSLVFQRDDEPSHHLDPEFGSEKALLMDPPLK